MTVLAIGTSTLAHAVHYSVLGVGLLGLVALLGPHLVPWSAATRSRDDHQHRVDLLRAELAGTTVLTRTQVARTGTGTRTGRLLPIAIMSSASAASVHAALGPEHFRERALFGLFFATAALAQMGWAVAMTVHPTGTLLKAAVVGNAVTIALWALTRTVGLPGGLLPDPEPVGFWDLVCTAGELVVVATCVALLLQGTVTNNRRER